MGLLVNPETAKAIEDLLHSEEGEVITCDGSNVDS